jgi:hypothetical protein
MNRECRGFWFWLPGEKIRRYRCLMDGRILSGSLAPSGADCPHCGRPVKLWDDGNAVELDVKTVRMVRLPDSLGGDWQELPE